MSISLLSFSQLSGTYTVGPTGNFATPSEAVQALNAQGISGNVTFSIQPGTYDVFASIENFPGGSFSDKVTFTSSTGNADDVILQHSYTSSEPYLLQIDSGKHIIIRDLSFNPVNYNKSIEIKHTVDLSILNCKFFRNAQSSSYNNGYIYLYSYNENKTDSMITIQNCNFEKGSVGIKLWGFGTSNIYRANISNNAFIEQGYAAIIVNSVNDTAIVSNNNIYSSYHDVNFGISVDYLSGYVLMKNNKITLNSQLSAGYETVGIRYSNCTPTNHSVQFYNNIVYVSNNTGGDVYGLYISNGNYKNAQFNTSVVDGDSSSSALYFRAGADNYIIQNNNLVNFGSGYVFRTYDTFDITNDINIFDYNNCYTAGTYFCRWVGNEYSLQDFRTATSYAFLNHLTQIPSSFYVTDNNYAVSCNNLQGTGIADTLVTIDFNNVSRPTTPTVGAIEYIDTSFALINTAWTNSCGADSNIFELINVTYPSYLNTWLYNNDTIGENIVNFNYYVNSSNWLKVDLARNNCLLSDSVLLTIDTIPIVNLGNDTALCKDANPINLSVNSGYTSYLWSTGETTNNIQIDPSIMSVGTSNIYIDVTNGTCSTSDSINITINQLPQVFLGNDTTICQGDTLTLNAGNFYFYDWSDGQTTPTIDVTSSDSYFVVVTDSNGCENISNTINVDFVVCTNVDEINKNTTISIYPNPAHSNLQITTSNEQLGKNIEILDITGKVVSTFENSKTFQKLDISNLQNGIYFIKINNTVAKFIKE